MPSEYVIPQITSELIGEEQSLAANDIDITRHEAVERAKEAAASPSPLARLLQDPKVARSLAEPRKSRKSSRSPHRDHSPVLVALALVEEERQTNQLKNMLRGTGQHLESEIRRGKEAEARADYAEMRTKEAFTRMLIVERNQHQLELELNKVNDDRRTTLMQLETAQRELRRVKADVERLERQKKDLERSVTEWKKRCGNVEQELRECHTREQGREEGQLDALDRYYHRGQDDGWEEGREEGFEEGRKHGIQEGRRKGRKEGFQEGIEQGRIDERRDELEAFDRFLTEVSRDHYYDSDDEDEQLTIKQRWADSIHHPNARQRPSPPSTSISLRM